jgi:hypothetical protein
MGTVTQGQIIIRNFFIIVASFLPLLALTILRAKHNKRRPPAAENDQWLAHYATDHRYGLAQRWSFIGAVVFLNLFAFAPGLSWWWSQHVEPVYQVTNPPLSEAERYRQGLRSEGYSSETIAKAEYMRAGRFSEKEIADWLVKQPRTP